MAKKRTLKNIRSQVMLSRLAAGEQDHTQVRQQKQFAGGEHPAVVKSGRRAARKKILTAPEVMPTRRANKSYLLQAGDTVMYAAESHGPMGLTGLVGLIINIEEAPHASYYDVAWPNGVIHRHTGSWLRRLVDDPDL